jgi:hypothetical protein
LCEKNKVIDSTPELMGADEGLLKKQVFSYKSKFGLQLRLRKNYVIVCSSGLISGRVCANDL